MSHHHWHGGQGEVARVQNAAERLEWAGVESRLCECVTMPSRVPEPSDDVAVYLIDSTRQDRPCR
jgi:hypothetical protein